MGMYAVRTLCGGEWRCRYARTRGMAFMILAGELQKRFVDAWLIVLDGAVILEG